MKQRGFIGILIAAVLLVISFTIPVLVRLTDAIFLSTSAQKSGFFLQTAFDAKYVFVKYFHDNPSSVFPSEKVSCGKIYVPPEENPASFLIQKDPWGRQVAYQRWDLRTENPPEDGLIIRFVSAGPDGIISTTKNTVCANSDICYEIFNCEIDQLVTAYEVKNGS